MILYKIARGAIRVCFRTVFRWDIRGRENVPSEGAVILCCNHISNWDPLFLGSPIERQVHYMAKEELFRVPGLGWLIRQFGAFPVKRGGVSKDSIKQTLAILREGRVLGIFPEGTRNADLNNAAKRGAATFALKTGATVIPVAIIGDYRLFRRMKIVYGSPVDLSDCTSAAGDADPVELATNKIMASIRENLSKN
jgi:1-acyl-sn-glycerol-3-phosphate acyltransferase